MKNLEVKDVLFFDVETTGLPAKGAKWDTDFEQFPHVVQIAWAYGEKVVGYIIKPEGWDIPAEVSEIHGITTADAEMYGETFEFVMQEFIADAAQAQLVCAHNIYFDTSIIKANGLRHLTPAANALLDDALFKGKRIDTMMKTIRFVGALYSNGKPGKFPKLEELYAKLFDGATFPAHDAVEDVKALKQCLPPLVDLGIIELKQKEYPAEQTKLPLDSQTSAPVKKTRKTARKPAKTESYKGDLEFNDTNAVQFPVCGDSPEPIKCATFAPETIPADVRAQMQADRKQAESRQMLEADEF